MSARPVFVRQRVEVAFYGDGTLEQPDTVQMTVDLTEAQQIVDRLGANAFMVLFHLVSLAEVDRAAARHPQPHRDLRRAERAGPAARLRHRRRPRLAQAPRPGPPGRPRRGSRRQRPLGAPGVLDYP